MNIDCYFLNWNEGAAIKLTIEHYQRFCRRVTVYDNYSDDGSDVIAREMGCEIRKFGTSGVLDDYAYLEVKNNCWRESDADYVIVCDADELIYHNALLHLLDMEKHRNTSLFRTAGYNMFCETFPRGTFTEVKTGIPDGSFSKSIMFDPKAIKEINYLPGCHVARPEGRVEVSLSTLNVLHYRCIGGFERFYNRHKLYNQRLSSNNRRWKMGNYAWVEDPLQVEAKSLEFDWFLKNSKVLESVFGYSFGEIHPALNGG